MPRRVTRALYNLTCYIIVPYRCLISLGCIPYSVYIAHLILKCIAPVWDIHSFYSRTHPVKYAVGFVTHYTDVILSKMASQITSLTIVCSAVYSVADQRIHQSSASLAFVIRIHRWPVNSPHKGPVTRKKFPFDDVIMDCWCSANNIQRLAIPCKDPLVVH